MVRINSIALAGLAAVGALARPTRSEKRDLGLCMTDDQAAFVAQNYGTLIASYTTELANNVLSENFTDYSESVNTLINTCPQGAAAISLPLLAPTFTSREMFEIGQGQQPPINFQQLNIWTSCDAVVIRWMTTNTANITDVKPVVGLIAMEVVPNQNLTAALTYPWLIDYVYSEFDAGAWLQNLQEAGICGPAPADSQQVPQEPTAGASTCSCAPSATATVAPVEIVSTSATSAPSVTATSTVAPVEIATSSSSEPSVYATSTIAPVEISSSSSSSAAAASSTSTGGMTVVVGSDGTVTEEPCA